MRRSVPKAIAMIAVGVLCCSGMLLYFGQHLVSKDRFVPNGRPPAGLGLLAVGIGLLVAAEGLIFTAALLDRKRGTKLAISLMVLGSISFVLGLAIAHAPMFVILGGLAMVLGAIIGLIAILFQDPGSEPRR